MEGEFGMSSEFTFSSLQLISIVCSCGILPGNIELMNWGIRIHFECRDCGARVSMQVKDK